MKNKFLTLAGVVFALAIALLGCIFWSGREFYWAGEHVAQHTQHWIGAALVIGGVLIALFVGMGSKVESSNLVNSRNDGEQKG